MNEKNWMVFDCETDSFDGKEVHPFIWGWITRDNIYDFTYSKIDFVNVLKNFNGIALAHNGGKFDTLLLAEYFNIDSPIKIINGRVAEVQIGDCLVRDSFLIIPEKLAVAGEKDEFDYKILNRNKKHLREIHKIEIEKYLKQDCVALKNLVEVFYKNFGQSLTLAGAALKFWERMTPLKRRYDFTHDNFFRQFYYGGRVQAFRKGVLGDDWNYYDIKSSYPHAMKQKHTACHLSEYAMHSDIKKITPQSFARIIAINRGCLPSREKYTTEFLVETGAREFFATGWEIIAGIETNTLHILEATIYTPTRLESLEKYVEYFYAIKIAAETIGDKINRTIAKLFMNALSGKFGANPENYHSYKIVEINERPDEYDIFLQGDDFDIVKKLSGGQFYDVALSASITGCARAQLFRQMLKCSDIAYCDTDSIICRDGQEHFDIGKKIGQWEHVAILDNLNIAGKKLYTGFDLKTVEQISAHKGFSVLDITHEDIEGAARGLEKLIERSAPTISVLGEQKFIKRTLRST